MLAKRELHEAMLWEKERNGVRCYLCPRRCFVAKDKRGYCLVRLNKDNRLYALNHGRLVNIEVAPIEKNYQFHFYPGNKSLIIFSPGTNVLPQPDRIFLDKEQLNTTGKEYSYEKIVKEAEDNGCRAVSYSSYTHGEAIMNFEFIIKATKLAHRGNVKNILVTNGYMSEEAAKKITKFLDAATINFEASADPEFYQKFMDIRDTKPLFSVLKKFKKHRVHIEITNLIVPQVGDSLDNFRKFVQWITSDLGSETPLHILQFYPDTRLPELPPTPVSTLERCAEEARRTGLRYVYIGNVPNHTGQNTYCYNCRELLIERDMSKVRRNNLVKDRCRNCGVKIDVVVD
jgi:pyruvate formate lyase activating enzyme